MDATASHVAEVLRVLGVRGQVRELPEPAPTAAAAAAQLGCEVGAIANSLIFAVDGEPLLVLTSGAHRVDTKRVQGLLGTGKLKRADPEFVAMATGQQVGGVAPVGHPTVLRTVVDAWLGKHEVVWAGGGDEHTMFPTSLDELVRITDGLVAEVGD
ncbi:YbaK/EbsC family protein [Actinomadura scrupuli]|uniref:YbaK/EbsC family protein n=1 Tax=Actinomadura scrupuli TaxID=559629 RepID=UPI003D95172C